MLLFILGFDVVITALDGLLTPNELIRGFADDLALLLGSLVRCTSTLDMFETLAVFT